MKPVNVTKSSGDHMPFSEERLKRSLYRSGAETEQVEYILDEVRSNLYEGIPTKKIYKIAFAMLKGGSRHLAARYHLKHAIMELGPSGFPFEQYIARILQHEGYAVKTGQIVPGLCVDHEIDVIAKKENTCITVECKYHNSPEIICNVRTPLYIHARFLDIQKNWCLQAANKGTTFRCQIVTNTRFSEDAIKYCSCSGLEAISWDFPANHALKDRVDSMGLYPVTCLTSLTKAEKQKLLDKRLVLCSDLKDHEKILLELGIRGTRLNVVMNEVKQLCNAFRPDQRGLRFNKK
jgi:Holliday junction resolvase-like predicted endonuclease